MIMKNSNFQNYLFKYYKKETNSFIGHLNKAKTVSNEKNIHQLRVDIKKIRAVFHLLQLLFPKEFNGKKHYRLIKQIFESAGEVREVQVNVICLAGYKLSPSILKKYKLFYKKNADADKRKLKKMIAVFEVGLLNKSKTKIKKLLKELDDKKISGKCQSFIKEELRHTEQLIQTGNNPATIHKIRMHLKSLEAIALLFYKMYPGRELKKLLILIKKNGVLIGHWHDKIVLTKSLKEFSSKNGELSKADLSALSAVMDKITTENQLFIKNLKGTMNPIFKISRPIN